MAQVIARTFASHDKALAAEKALRGKGLPANEIHVLAGNASQAPTPPAATSEPVDSETQAVTEDWTPTEQATPPAAPAAAEETTARLARLGIPADEAAVYARELSQGHSLVTVRPPFGTAQTAINTLHEFDPIPLEVHETRPAPPPESPRAAPFSAKFGWRVLLDDPEPLSRALGWKTLQPDPETSKTSEQVHKLSSEPAPLSDRLKLPVLSRDPAPLSSAVKMPTLSDDPAPLSHAAKLKLLSDDPAPLSNKAGWRLLLDDPAPLSRKAGWRLLLKDPAPLSRLLGLPVLLKR